MKRALRAQLMVVAAAVTIAGCSTPTTPEEAVPQTYIEAPTVTPAAQAAFGDTAEATYREVAQFLVEESVAPELLDPQRNSYSKDELTQGVSSKLTPQARASWESHVDKFLAGDTEASHVVQLLRPCCIQLNGVRAPRHGDPIDASYISGGVVDVDTTAAEPTLLISADHRTHLDYVAGRSPEPAAFTRRLTLAVVTEPAITSGTGAAAASPASAQDGQAALQGRAPTWRIANFEGKVAFGFDDQANPTTAPAG